MFQTKARFSHPWLFVCSLACCVLAWPLPAEAAKIRYLFKSWNSVPLRVYVTRPVGLAADRPVVFVMHGANRNAADIRDQWHELAVWNDFLLVVPEFSERRFPDSGSYDKSYTAIEAIFDDLHSRFGMTTGAYSLFGQSDGAQFVHRFIFHVPGARLDHAVAANAGWYMMPDFGVAFPYGLKGSLIDDARLANGLQAPLTILLGTENTDPGDPALRRTPEAMAQGRDRPERGQAFFSAARDAAASLDVPFNWSLVTVEGDVHDKRLMVLEALPLLLGR